MSDFCRRRHRDGQDRWWLAFTGNGDKERLPPATTELMAELARYLRHYGLAALTYGYGSETTPLLLPMGGTHRTLTHGGLHLIIIQVFDTDNTIDHVQSTGEAHECATERLLKASRHRLRPTAGSHDGRPSRRAMSALLSICETIL